MKHIIQPTKNLRVKLFLCACLCMIITTNGFSQENMSESLINYDQINIDFDGITTNKNYQVFEKDYTCSIDEMGGESGKLITYYSNNKCVMMVKIYGDYGGHCAYEDRFYNYNESIKLVYFKSDCWYFNENADGSDESLTADDITTDYIKEEKYFYQNGLIVKSLMRETNTSVIEEDLEYQEQELYDDPKEDFYEYFHWAEFSKSTKNCEEYFEY